MKLIRSYAGHYHTEDWMFTVEKHISWWNVCQRVEGKYARRIVGTFHTLKAAQDYIIAHSFKH